MKHITLSLVAILILANAAISAHAQVISGSVNLVPLGTGSSYTLTSFTLGSGLIPTVPTGDLSGITLSGFSYDSGTISVPLTASIPDFFEFSTATDSDQFTFTLTSTTYYGVNGTGYFTGSGILYDTNSADGLLPTYATLNISYSGQGNYSGSVVSNGIAAPEPSTWALMLGGLTALGFFVRRRVAR